MSGVSGPVELLVILFMVVLFTVFPFWMICTKAGFPGWYSLATVVPILNIFFIFFLAFAEWPALRIPFENRDAENQRRLSQIQSQIQTKSEE